MARTPSKMLPLGTKAPFFRLPDPSGRLVSFDENSKANGFLIMFICNHCPFVKHIAAELAKLGQDYSAKGIQVYAVNSNDIENYPEDHPDKMAVEIKERGYVFPYLFDESQTVAKSYDAACTPDFYLFDAGKRLVYRGQLDDSRPGNGIPVTGKDLRLAMDALLSGKKISDDQKPSIGCNIKWKT